MFACPIIKPPAIVCELSYKSQASATDGNDRKRLHSAIG
jgi:hypothetical protein